MNICITSYGKTVDSEIDPRFGRCSYFFIVNTVTMDFEVIENENYNASGGAGIQAGQLLSEKNIDALLTGNVGPNAYQTLTASGIKVYTGVSGTVKDAIEKFKNNGFKESDKASVDSHFGIKS